MKLLNTKRWEKQRAKGFRHFVFVTGVFSFGVPLTLFIVGVEWWNLRHVGFFERYPSFWGEFVRISSGLVLLGGPLVGALWVFLT